MRKHSAYRWSSLDKPIPFPRAGRSGASAGNPAQPPGRPPGRATGGRILLLGVPGEAGAADAVAPAAESALQSIGHQVTRLSTGKEALSLARKREVDLVVAESRLPDLDAADLLERVHQIDPEIPVIILTECGDIDTAIECIRRGAFDYIARPLNLGSVIEAVNSALDRRMRPEPAVARPPSDSRDSFGMLIGRSEAMKTVFSRIAKIAPQSTTVLILGESGTGKEMVAKEIHQRSPVAGGPFIAVNCGGVTGELIESELYGHERGAFTGAAQAHNGLFHAAQRGTLFLDEIGAMPLAQQSSLLRALEKKEIRRVGGTRTFHVDVRVIAATNNDLDQSMEAGLFRPDLFYRLSRMIIHLPSLRERVEDVPLLCEHFIKRYCKEHSLPLRKLSYQALELLCNRTWRGNVRELENVIEQAVFFSRRELIKPTDLPIPRDESAHTELRTLDEVMRAHIVSVLAHTAGNKLKAARILDIPRPTLYHRMKRLGLEDTPQEPGPRRGKKSKL